MAIGTGVTEIAESEEELLMSSPAAVSDAAVDKLSATACQDAQVVACPHQKPAEHSANEASSRTDRLGVDQQKPSSNPEATHLDPPDLQPVQQIATNDISTCTTSALIKPDVPPPQANIDAVGVNHQVSCADVDSAGGETSALQDTKTVTETGTATQLDDRTSTPINVQIEVSNGQDNEQQPSPSEPLPVNYGGVDIEHVKPSMEGSQDEALDSHTATLEPSHTDLVHLISRRQEPIQCDPAGDRPTKDVEGADDEAVAGRPQHDISLETSVELPAFTATDPPDLSMNTSHAIPYTTDASDSMDLDPTLAATDLATSRTGPAQDTNVTALPGSHDGCSIAESPKPEQIIGRAAGASALLADAEPTADINYHKLSGNGSSTSSSAARSTATHAFEPHVEKPGNQGMALGATIQASTTMEDTFTQTPTASLIERGPEEIPAPAKAEEAIAEQVNEIPARSTTEAVQSSHPQDRGVEDDQSLASAAPETQTQSQFTASQASEPTPPCPAAKLTPQEVTLAKLRAQKAALLASLGALPAIQVLIEENQTSDVDMSDDDGEPTDADIMAAANNIVKEHIKLLHDYNELKDVGQGLMGLIADQRGVRIVEVQDELGIDAND
ncbi:hypothetical protein BU25DRAFT_255947 [Macroventuria anomochaeta]|uniref:Uncharacterized protein n=1 Tax=Macroventuria anomochaeta TaxID=301207 RepID=A0ACB6SAC9_9PLEO|nr:uncharacterized protein BU25DRAFT_255947 [Macroventuria anomochaeta]KAF2630308.1 hypothetical protein BU25DRAFT_255947 [Macroventuria anomochaeta]